MIWDVENRHTRDDEKLEPLNGFCYPEVSCYESTEAKKESSSTEYAASLSADVSSKAEFESSSGSGKFAASSGYKMHMSDVQSSNSEQFSIVSYCLQYYMTFKQLHVTLDPVRHFTEAAALLPVVESAEKITPADRDAWNIFFAEFGTHYVHELHLGGKMVTTVKLSEKSHKYMVSMGVSVKAAIEGEYSSSAVKAKGSATMATKAEAAGSKALSSVDKEVKIQVYGGLPPSSDPQDPAAFGRKELIRQLYFRFGQLICFLFVSISRMGEYRPSPSYAC